METVVGALDQASIHGRQQYSHSCRVLSNPTTPESWTVITRESALILPVTITLLDKG